MMEKISSAANLPMAKSSLRGWPTGPRSVCAKRRSARGRVTYRLRRQVAGSVL